MKHNIKNNNILSERQKAVMETVKMRLTEKESLEYLKDNGFEISDTTLYREKNKLEKMKLKRLYQIAKYGFE
jgi:maleate cis-trans isomerase